MRAITENIISIDLEPGQLIEKFSKVAHAHGAPLIVDSGNFDWMAYADKFPGLCTPDDSYHGITYAEKFGKEGAFITQAFS